MSLPSSRAAPTSAEPSARRPICAANWRSNPRRCVFRFGKRVTALPALTWVMCYPGRGNVLSKIGVTWGGGQKRPDAASGRLLPQCVTQGCWTADQPKIGSTGSAEALDVRRHAMRPHPAKPSPIVTNAAVTMELGP